MSVVNIPTSATGFHSSIVGQAKSAQRVVNGMQITPNLNAKGFVQPLGRIANSASEFQKSMDASAARVFAFGAAVGVINGVSDAFKGLVTSTAEVEKSLKDIQVVMEVSNEAMQKFGKGLFDVARNTATSFATVAESAVELARQGLSAEETLARVNSALILSRLSGLDAVKSTETLTAAINSFNAEGITHEEIVNRMANVDAAFAVSSADMAEAISRAGAVAQSAGVSFNELSAIVTAVQQRTARGGSVIGNGFKSIFTRIKRSGVREALEEIGVATQKNDGTFRSSIAVLKDYAQVYKGLSDSQRASTSEQIAGVFQIQNLQALIQDLSGGFSVYEQALSVANNTTDEATRRNQELNETLSALFSQTGTSAKELASTIGNLGFNDDFKEILKFLNSLAEGINNLLDEDKGSSIAKSLVKGISSFLTGPGLVLIGAAFIKIFGLVGKFAKEAFSDLLGINSETKRQQTLQAAIGAMLSQNAGLYQQILATGKNQAAQERIILNAIQAETAERLKQEAIVKRIAASSRLIGVGAGESGFVPMGKRGSRTTGKKTLGMASGFIPEVRQEQSSIEKGIGGAKKTDRPKTIRIRTRPNKLETVVANTGEVLVKNYLNSGADAIFNREMIRKQGMPEKAKKITAAMGYIPNFKSTVSQKRLENKKHKYSAAELGWSQFGQSTISKYADHYDTFTGTIKVDRLDKDIKHFSKTATKIVQGDKSKPAFPALIYRDDVKDPENEKKYKKYNVSQKSLKMLSRRYGSLMNTAPYSGIKTVANNIKKGQYGNKENPKKIPEWTKKRPAEYDPLFGQLSNLLKGIEGEHQSKKYLKRKGYRGVKTIPGSKNFDIEARDEKNRRVNFESKAVEKQNVIVGLKKGSVEYLQNLISKQPKGKKTGIKDGRRTNINLTGKGNLFSGGIRMLTAKDTQLNRSIITSSDINDSSSKLKKSGMISYIDSLAGNNAIKTSASTLSKKEINRRIDSFISKKENEPLLESLSKYVSKSMNAKKRKPLDGYAGEDSLRELLSLEDKFSNKISLAKRKKSSSNSMANETANTLFPFGVSFLSKGYIPNFIDRRNRSQKIKDVLSDPANKNIKFNSPLSKKMSIDTEKKGMGGEFQKMWLESYFKSGRVGDYQMLMKMGYDPDKLKALRKHSEQGGQVDIKTMANGMIPNFAMRRGDLRRYTQQVHAQGIKDPKGKLFFKGEKYREVKFDSPKAEKDKASWIKPSYQTIQGDRNEIKEFSSYLETRKDLKPYVVDNFKKEYTKELKGAKQAQEHYWETYDKIKSGNAGLYERNGFYGRKSMPSEDPLKVQLKYLKKDQIDNLVSDFKKQQKPSFSEGYVPNFTDSTRKKVEGLGKYTDVSSVVNERGKTLDIGMIMSEMSNSGPSIYKKLLKEIESAAKEGKPYTKINAGAIIGPRIPKLLLATKKILDKKRLTQDIPPMTLDGMFNPARLYRKVQEHRRVSYNKEKQTSRDPARYTFGEEASLKKSLRGLGLGPSRDKKDKTAYLHDLWVGKNFVDGHIPSFANLTLWRGQSKKRKTIDEPSIGKTMPSFEKAKTPEDIVGIMQSFTKSHVSGPLSGYRDIGDIGNKMPSGATSFSTSETSAKRFAGATGPNQKVTERVLSKTVPEKNVFNKKKLLKIFSKGADPEKGYYPKVEEFKRGIKDGSIKNWAKENGGIYLNVFGRRNDRSLMKFNKMAYGRKEYDFYDKPMNQMVPLKDIGRNSNGTAQISPREAEVMQVMSEGRLPDRETKPLNLAGGFVPAMNMERRNIAKGVGGARSGDRPVKTKIRTSPGKAQSAVVHTGEWIVRNYQGSGADAVFNRNMAKSMGLPAGAKKVNAASGYIPNYSASGGVMTKRGWLSTAKVTRLKDPQGYSVWPTVSEGSKQKKGEKSISLKDFDYEDKKAITGFKAKFGKENLAVKKQAQIDQRNAMPHIDASRTATMLVPTHGKRGRVNTTFKAPLGLIGAAKEESRPTVRMQYRVEGLKPSRLKGAESNIRSSVKEGLLEQSKIVAHNIAGPRFASQNKPITTLANAGSVGAAAGTVFETAVQSIGKNKLFTTNNANFDIAGFPDEKLQHLFGYYTPFADAKIGLTKDTKADFNTKLLKLPENAKKLADARKVKQQEASAAMRAKHGPATKTQGSVTALSGGFIPSFAQKPLSSRQKESLRAKGYSQEQINSTSRKKFNEIYKTQQKEISYRKKQEVAKQERIASGYKFSGFKYGSNYEPVVKPQSKVSVEAKIKESNKFGKAGVAFSSINSGKINNVSNRVGSLEARVKDLEMSRSTQNFAQGFIPSFANSRPRAIEKFENPEQIYNESRDYLDNPRKAYSSIPNFVLSDNRPSRKKWAAAGESNVGFIESSVREGILNGKLRGLVEDNEKGKLKFDGHTIIKPNGEKVNSYDIFRYANDEKAKRYIRDDINMKTSKATQSSAWSTLKSLVTGEKSAKMSQVDSFLRGANQSPGWTVHNGTAYINSSTVSDLVSKPGATAGMYNISPNTVSVENLITQTGMDFSAGKEERQRFQERRDKTGSKSKKPISDMLSGARYGVSKAIGRVTDLANLSNLGKINIGSRFIEQYGKVSSSLGGYIEKFNMGNMTEKQREKYIAVKEKIQERVTSLKDGVSKLNIGSAKKRLESIKNKIYTVGGEKGYTYVDSHRNMSGESYNNYRSIKNGSTITIPEIEDSNTKTLRQDSERKYQLQRSLMTKEKKREALRNRIDSVKKYGSEIVDKSGKIINTSLMAPIELSKKLGSGALRLKDGAVGAFRQIDFQKGVTNTIDTMRDIKGGVGRGLDATKDKITGAAGAVKEGVVGGARSMGQPILTGFVRGIDQASKRSQDFKRQAQAWGISQIKSARDLVSGGLNLFKVPEGIKGKGNAITQGFLSFFGTGAPKNKTIDNLKEKVSTSSQQLTKFWKNSVENIGSKFNFNNAKDSLSGKFEGLSERIKGGVSYAGEKTISPLIYGVQRAWEKTKEQAHKIKEAGIARALEVSQSMAFSQGGTDQEKIQSVKERLKSSKSFVAKKFKGLSAGKMGINPKSLTGLSLLALPFAQTGEAPSEQEDLTIPDSKFESRDESIRNELIGSNPKIKALINSEYKKYSEQKTGKKSDTFLEHLNNHKALKGTVTKELEEKYKDDEDEPNYLMRQILTALGVISLGGFALHKSRKNKISNEKFNYNNLKIKNDLISNFPLQESSINNKYEEYLKIKENKKESFKNYLSKDKNFQQLGMGNYIKNASQYDRFPAIRNSKGETKKLKPAEMQKYNLFSEILDQELRTAKKEMYSMEVLGQKSDGTPLDFEDVGPKKDPKTGYIERATGVTSRELEEHKKYIKDLQDAIKKKDTFYADSLQNSRLRHKIPEKIGQGVNKIIPKFLRRKYPRLNFSEGYVPNLAHDANKKANNVEYANFARGFFGLKGRRPASLTNGSAHQRAGDQNPWISKNIFKEGKNKKTKLEDSNNIVYDKTRFRDSKERVLEIKAIQSEGATSGAEIFKTLYNQIEKAAAQGKPFTKIDAGQVTGPKIPDLIVRAKKILDKKRKSGVDIPKMEIAGGFSPQRIWKRSEPGNKGQENWLYGDVGYGVGYTAKERARAAKAMREMGVKRFDGADEAFYLQNSPMFQKGFADGMIPNFVRMAAVTKKRFSKKLSRDEHVEMRQATESINALSGAKKTHLATPKRDGGTVRKVRNKDDQEAILKYIETRRPFKTPEVEAKALDIWGIKRKTLKDSRYDSPSRNNDPFYNPQQAERQFDPIMGIDPIKHGARSGNGLYFADGMIPNFSKPARRFKKFDKKKYLKELAKGKNRHEKEKINAYVKAAGGAQKFQKINEKFGLDKIDDIFNVFGIFSQGHIPNFSNPLQAAVSREASALKTRGISASNIKIEKSSVLKSYKNPMGLAVTNKIDEPGGVHQGIARARKMGINPKKHGMASGFIPNYNRFLSGALSRAGQATKDAGRFGLNKLSGMTPEQKSNMSMGAMFMGPMAAEMMMGEDRESAGMGQRIASGAAMGAGYGAMFGPKGMAIGAAAGAVYGGAEGVIKQDTGDSFKELKQAKKGLDKIMSDTKAMSEYGNALSGLEEAMKSGDLGALDELEASLQESLSNISSPELLNGLIELQDSGASAAESLDFVNLKLGELQSQAMALQTAVGASDKLSKHVDDETGFWNSTGNFFGAIGDFGVSAFDGAGELLGMDFTKTTYDERRRKSTDLMGSGKQGDLRAEDLAKGYVDSLKQFSKVSETSILAGLSDGSRFFSGIETEGKSIDELKQDTVLMSRVRDTAADETSDNYERMTSGMIEQGGDGKYRVKGEYREEMENTLGGDKSLKIFEQQLNDSDKFFAAITEGIKEGGDSLENLAKISEKGIGKAIEREKQAAKLQKELMQGYENMLSMQERIANTISNVNFADSMNQQDRDFKANFASEGLEFMNANGGMSRQDVLSNQNKINQSTLKSNSSDDLKSELLNILKSNIDPTAVFDSKEISQKYGESSKEKEPSTAEGRAKKGLEDAEKGEQKILAEKFDKFLQANEDGNLTLGEMTGFLQSIDSEGKVGNGILKQAQTAADRNAQKLAQEMKQASLNMLKQRAVTASQRLGSMGGSLLTKDDELQLGNLTAKGAFQGNDAESMDATMQFINMIGADPSDFGVDKTTAQYTIAMGNIDKAERANRANGGSVNFDDIRQTLKDDFKAIKEYEAKSEQLMKEILGDGGSKADVDVQIRDILARILTDGLIIRNLGESEKEPEEKPPVEKPAEPTPEASPTPLDQNPFLRPKGYVDPTPDPTTPDVTENKPDKTTDKKPLVVQRDKKKPLDTPDKSGWSYYQGAGYGSSWGNYAGSASGYSKKVDEAVPTKRSSRANSSRGAAQSHQTKELAKSNKENSEKVVQGLEKVENSLQETSNTESLENTVSELRATIEAMSQAQQTALSPNENPEEPVPVQDESSAYDNFISAVDMNTQALYESQNSMIELTQQVGKLGTVIESSVAALISSGGNQGKGPGPEDPDAIWPKNLRKTPQVPLADDDPRLQKMHPMELMFEESRRERFNKQFGEGAHNNSTEVKRGFYENPQPTNTKKDNSFPVENQGAPKNRLQEKSDWQRNAEYLKGGRGFSSISWPTIPSAQPTYPAPSSEALTRIPPVQPTYSEPTRPQYNPAPNYVAETSPNPFLRPRSSRGPTDMTEMMGSYIGGLASSRGPTDMTEMMGSSMGGLASHSSMLKGSLDSMSSAQGRMSSMGDLSNSTSSIMSRQGMSMSGFSRSLGMEGIMSPISQQAQISGQTFPSSISPAYSNPISQPISNVPFPSQNPIPGASPSGGNQPEGSGEIVSAVNQLKESFEAKPPAGTEEMQELIAAVNNIEEAYRASIPETPDDPPSGGDEGGSIVQITEALKSLPAELKSQLQEITFSHAITGDVKFNFNTEAMAGALGPALNSQLKDILQQPMILDVLSKALKGRIDPSGVLGR